MKVLPIQNCNKFKRLLGYSISYVLKHLPGHPTPSEGTEDVTEVKQLFHVVQENWTDLLC